MCKNRLGLHIVAILAIVFFAFLAIGSTASTPKAAPTGDETVVSSQTSSNGLVYNSKPAPLERQYDTLGLVFATTTTRFNEKGFEIASEEGIITMLLREAQKLGGNDIVNLRTDQNVVVTETKVSGSDKTYTSRTVTITGSALAIKYRNGNDALVPQGYLSGGGSGGGSSGGISAGNLVPNKFTLEGTVK